MLTLILLISRKLQGPGAAKKRVSRGRRRLYAFLRYADGIMITGGLFGLAIALFHTQLLFVLLPTALSVAVTAITVRSRVSTVRALAFTAAVALAFFSAITGWELFSHPVSTPIILVTTTLAVAVILQPLRALVQSWGEQRFHLIDDTVGRTVDAFTSALRQEIDLDQVRERLFEVVRQTMNPRFVAVWAPARITASSDPDLSPQTPLPTGEGEAHSAGGEVSADLAAQEHPHPALPAPDVAAGRSKARTVTIAPDDALAAYALAHPGALEVARLPLDSPATRTLKTREAELALPLVSQGELLGLLVLGARLDGDDYSREDRRLLATLAAQAAPALSVARLVRTRQAEVRERERIEQELQTAQQIQRTFLPKEVPALPGWQLVPSYQPAREVGGDFYDFLPLGDGRLGIVLGDVTGKGIPAALVMTAARTMLRTAAQADGAEPAGVLARVNELLHADIPPGMFVTCFYAVLDPTDGQLCFANAGQDLPYLRHPNGSVSELRATGMPLGMLPGSSYDSHETTLAPGDSLLFFSDGLVEAHNSAREMFGLPRVQRLLGEQTDSAGLIESVLDDLKAFTGPGWEQEDDVTLVALRRLSADGEANVTQPVAPGAAQVQMAEGASD